jgi:hypothetical protein
MTDQSSIKYISSFFDGTPVPGGVDNSRISSLRQVYPYFVPVRYIEASANHESSAFSPAMLSAIQPYLGDWLVFCDFLTAKESTPQLKVCETPDAEPLKVASEKPEVVPNILLGVQETKAPDVPETFINTNTPVEEAVIADVVEETEHVILPIPDEEVAVKETIEKSPLGDSLITPLYSKDYLLHRGEKVPDELPAMNELKADQAINEEDKSLMVMMSFTEWLIHFKNSSEKEKEETKDQKALRTMWQKEKLAAAIDEENEEIPEKVFEMAVNSISMEEGLASETLADIYIKQGKYDQAIEMYRKLSLRNPQKSAYFARKIEEALKDKQS